MWLPHLAFAVHREKQCFIAFIFYCLKQIVTWHVISVILCSVPYWKREHKIWNTLCECFNILSKKAGFVWIHLNCSTSYYTGKIYMSSSNTLCQIENGENHWKVMDRFFTSLYVQYKLHLNMDLGKHHLPKTSWHFFLFFPILIKHCLSNHSLRVTAFNVALLYP